MEGATVVEQTIQQLTQLSDWWRSLTDAQRLSVTQPMRGHIITVIAIAHEMTKFEGELPKGVQQ